MKYLHIINLIINEIKKIAKDLKISLSLNETTDTTKLISFLRQ